MTTHPRNVIFLTADAFGILPPISRLTREQAQYHFISGYTAKLAGTEIGVTEPHATFSAGFGAPSRHPGEYARMLAERLERARRARLAREHRLDGRPVRRRRADADRPHPHMVRAALNGELADVPYERDPIFGVEVPTEVPGVPSDVLRPRSTWSDPAAYDEKAAELAAMFVENFAEYADGVGRGARRGARIDARPHRGGAPHARARRSRGHEEARRPRLTASARHAEEELEPLLEQRLRRLDVGELLGQRRLRARRDDQHLLAGRPRFVSRRAGAHVGVAAQVVELLLEQRVLASTAAICASRAAARWPISQLR